MNINLTEDEAKTLSKCIENGLIDARGLKAIGIGNGKNVTNLENIKEKIEKAMKEDK